MKNTKHFLTKIYPLYSAKIDGRNYDEEVNYEIVTITKWTSNHKDAEKESHKTFYFKSDTPFLQQLVHSEAWCEYIYTHYNNNDVIIFERKESI